jgi:hypothetical protein
LTGSPPTNSITDSDSKRLNMVVSDTWLRRIDDWRHQQPDLPNISEAIRRLVELGLKAKEK